MPPSMRAAGDIIRHDYQSSEEDDLITVTFDPKFDDLDAVDLKAAGNVILHVLAENDGSLRRAASKLGATHSTLTRILQKFDSIYGSVSLHSHLDTVQNFAAIS
jgi:DNA-binding NtrC family response regulator